MTKILKTSLENNSHLLICPECKNGVISDTQTGDTICNSCGLVISEKEIDISNSDKRAFDYEDIRNKVSTGFSDNILTPNIFFNTKINVNETKNKELKRSLTFDRYIHNPETRNLIKAIRNLKRVCSNLNIPYHVKVYAILLYKKAFKKNLIKGRSITGIVYASLYIACRIFNLPISLNEIINETDEKINKVYSFYTLLVKELNLHILPFGPEVFLSKYILGLKLNYEIEKRALELLSHLKSFSIGRDPKVICAGLIYLLCKKSRTQKEISDFVGISEPALRYTYKQIENYLQQLSIEIFDK